METIYTQIESENYNIVLCAGKNERYYAERNMMGASETER